ncbi:hypothetical protein ACLKA6_002575 [Drosophila palustris]
MELTARLGIDQNDNDSSFLTGFTTHPPPCFSRNARMSSPDFTPTATRLWTDDSIPGPAEGQFLLIRVALVTHSIMATTVDLWLHLADQQLQRNSWLKRTTVCYVWAPCVTCRQFIASEYRLPASSRHFQGWIRPSIDG